MPKKSKKISLYSLLFCIISILAISSMESKWQQKGSQAVLSWDVMGYYLYLPATFIYKDLRHLKFKDKIMEQYNPSSSFYQAFELEDNNWLMTYPLGLSVMYTPGFFIGHLGAVIGGYPQDGFSIPYQMSIFFWSLMIAFLGLWFLRSFLLNYFSDKAVGLTLVVIVLVTNYMNYTSIDAAMAHNYEFSLYAALLFFTRKWYLNPNYKHSVIIGLLIGLAALARPTDILIAIVPLTFGLASLNSIKKTFQFLIRHSPKLITAGLVTLLVGSLQLIYWKVFSGDWLYYTYQDYGFNWLHPYLKECFFSFKKGWLIYTPVMAFALIGFIMLFKNWPKLFWFSFIFFILNTYVVFSWDCWWYGGSFGQRAMVDSYAILAIPLTAFNQIILKSFWKYLILPLFIFFCWLNLFQIYQLHAEEGGMDPEFMTSEYYFRIFGKINVPNTDRKLLDTDEDFIGVRKNIKTIFTEDFESYESSDNVRQRKENGSKMCVFLNFDFQESPTMKIQSSNIQGKWLRINADFYAEWMEWDMWKMSELEVTFYKKDQSIKKRMIRIYRILRPEKWTKIWIDTQIPKESFDYVEFKILHKGSRTHLWIDNFQVETFDE